MIARNRQARVGWALPTPLRSLVSERLDRHGHEIGVPFALDVEADLAGAFPRRPAAVVHRGDVAVEDRALDPGIGDGAPALVRRKVLVDPIGFAADRIGEL